MVVKIILTHIDYERDFIAIISSQKNNQHLNENSEFYGILNEWHTQEQHYLRFPFTLEWLEGKEAIIDYGGWDFDQKTTLSIFNRRIVVGESVVKKESNDSVDYRVTSIEPFI